MERRSKEIVLKNPNRPLQIRTMTTATSWNWLFSRRKF